MLFSMLTAMCARSVDLCKAPASLSADLDAEVCSAALQHVRPPHLNSAAEAWRSFSTTFLGAQTPVPPWRERQAWVLVPFGFEVRMLALHVRTLQHVVSGFLVAESRSDIGTGARKPAHLSAALADGTFPRALARHIRLSVLDDFNQATGMHRRCGPRAQVVSKISWAYRRCLEAWQRFVPLQMLLQVAGPYDVAIVADTDEIARPTAVRLLTRCFPFGADGDEPSTLVLSARRYVYGAHCVVRAKRRWDHGPHAYSVAALNASFGRAAAALWSDRSSSGDSVSASSSSGGDSVSASSRSSGVSASISASSSASISASISAGASSSSFSATRPKPAHEAFDELRDLNSVTRPSLPDAGWHLSYFGTPAQLTTKFQTWGHARTFLPPPKGFERNGYEAAALDATRVGNCARFCLEPIAKACQALATPCNWSFYLSRRVPPCLARDDPQSRPLAETDHCPHRLAEVLKRRRRSPASTHSSAPVGATSTAEVAARELERAELPAPLLAPSARRDFPEYLRW